MTSVREAYVMGREHLAASGSSEPAIEAEVLLRHALQCDRTALYTRWDSDIEDAFLIRYRQLLEERSTGRPVPYIVGEREFMGLPFFVDERVMIPRPETEILVEYLIAMYKGRESGVGSRESHGEYEGDDSRFPIPDSRQLVFVDVGTGSGCIAISLAHYLPHAQVYATDISAAALEVAAHNARRHTVGKRVALLEGDLLTPLPDALKGNVDAVASNPPYVPPSQATMLAREIREFEPAVAVFAPSKGTSVHLRLISEAPRWIRPDGLLAMEVGAGQAEAVGDAARTDGRYDDVHVLTDLAGIDRVILAKRRR